MKHLRLHTVHTFALLLSSAPFSRAVAQFYESFGGCWLPEKYVTFVDAQPGSEPDSLLFPVESSASRGGKRSA